MDAVAHHDALLERGRCGRCAEAPPARALLRGEDCPRCGAPLKCRGGDDLLARLDRGRGRWRIVGYVLAALASFLTGWVPFLQFLVQLAALFTLHVLVLRRPLGWLSPGRRVAARTSIKLFGAALGCVNLVLNAVVIPMVGASALILGAAGFLMTAVYVEVGLSMIRRRFAWEADGRSLMAREWAIPAALLSALLVSVLGGSGLLVWGLQWMATSDIPHVHELARFILEV